MIDHDKTDLTEFLNACLCKLPLVTIDRVVDSGGICFLSVGIYTDGNMMCDFEEELLGKLSAHKIGLKFDMYGGPENDRAAKVEVG